MENNPKSKILPDEGTQSIDPNNYRERNKLIIPVGAGLIVLILIILYLSQAGESHYDMGLKYLKQKQYTEALVEFKKVNTDDDNFRMAQSKQNYINGMLANNEGIYKQSILFLAKVEPSDEYYRESRILMEKMDLANKQGNLESLSEQLKQEKDTVIIKEKIIEIPSEKISEADKSDSDLKTNKKYISIVQNLSGKFEILYQSAISSGMEAKKVFSKDMDSLYTEFKRYENISAQDSKIQELNRVAASWMEKRLSYIKVLVAENSVNESNRSISLKEQGDKDYKLLLNIINKN